MRVPKLSVFTRMCHSFCFKNSIRFEQHSGHQLRCYKTRGEQPTGNNFEPMWSQRLLDENHCLPQPWDDDINENSIDSPRRLIWNFSVAALIVLSLLLSKLTRCMAREFDPQQVRLFNSLSIAGSLQSLLNLIQSIGNKMRFSQSTE